MLSFKIKLFLINILFLLNLSAESLKEQIFLSGELAVDGKNFISLQDVSDEFLDQKHSKLTFKIKLNKELLKESKKIFYLRLECNLEDLASINVPYTLKNDYPIIKIDENTKEVLLLSFDYKGGIPFLELNVFSEFEHEYIMKNEKILFGIAYGIIICAFLYNFVFFLYNREKSFFYYSLLQISLLLMLLVISMDLYVFNLFVKYGNIIEFLTIFLLNLVFVLSILFNMSFLNTKKFTPKIHKFLWALLGLITLDLSVLIILGESIIDEYFPTYILILILLFSAFSVLIKGYKPAVFYIIGWLSLFVFVFLSETSLSEYSDVYLLHIGIPLESLLFSFALGFKIRQVELEKQKNERILINQSKLASMGEMISNIAHQWRQPLTHLSYTIMNVQASFENDKLNKKYLEEKVDEANNQIEFMSHTIDDFRNFFKVSKNKETFSLVACINESINLLKDTFKSLDIKLEFEYEDDFIIKTYKGELSQVIFNLLNNAKDEFIKNETKDAHIKINLYKKEQFVIEILDNAGGIDKKIINKIFEPYFTTKEKGLGIGLYMSKMIIDNNIGGKLKVENKGNGALFSIFLPTKI